MKNVLIVGAAGFLGKKLSQKCIELGWVVDAFVRKKNASLADGFRQVREAQDGLLPENYDFIFNAAAFIPYGMFDRPDRRLLESNIELPAELLKTYPNTRMIFSSSVSVYGKNTALIKEDSEQISPNLYGMSKLFAEAITKQHESFSILRFPSLYGRGMYQETFIPAIVRDSGKGTIALRGDGSRLQNYLHIDDAVGYCLQAASDTKNDTYLATAPRSYSNKQVAEIVSKYSNCKITFEGVDTSPSFGYDNQYTLKSLNFETSVKLEEGLKELL